MIKYFFGQTDVGRQRTNNEDTFIAEEVLQGRFVLACVIDGVGGYEGGEVAAQTARDAILDVFSAPSAELTALMKEALLIANEKIQAKKWQKPEYNSMACVVTMVVADEASKKFYYAHVGDTRLYLFRDQSLVKITKDHSFVGFLEDSGRLTETEAMQHPKRNEINKALGFDTPVGERSEYIEMGESPYLPGDLLLLCSDGLSDLVNRAAISKILSSPISLEEKTQELINAANNAGGKDNITVVLVQNSRKPIKRRATKPVQAPAREWTEEKEKVPPAENLPVQHKPKKTSPWVLFLSCLSAILLLAVLWLLLFQKKPEQAMPELVVMDGQQSALAHLLADSLSFAKTKMVLSDSVFSQPILLSDTLFIQNDSLHLKGNKLLVLQADSAYKGPAIVLAPNCKYVLLENVILNGFSTAIVTQNKSLQLKNVQFINCTVPVQYNRYFTDGAFVTGKLTDSFKVKTDSLLVNIVGH